MKRILQTLVGVLFLGSALISCKKDENQVKFLGNDKDVVLTSTASVATDYVFARVTNGNVFGTFNWNNPDFKFNTGISSQDVNYTLQVKKSTQTTWVDGASITKDLSRTFTVKDINDMLTLPAPSGLDLDPGVQHVINMRIKATIAGSANTAVFSNQINYNITPYSNDPDLWITGNATPSDWTNSPPPSQKFAYSRATKKFTITMAFIPGRQYKFLTVNGQWQPQWGGCGPNGGAISENPGGGSDPAAIDTPADAGNYLITVDLINKNCTVVRQ